MGTIARKVTYSDLGVDLALMLTEHDEVRNLGHGQWINSKAGMGCHLLSLRPISTAASARLARCLLLYVGHVD
jgi:hypothetical protein